MAKRPTYIKVFLAGYAQYAKHQRDATIDLAQALDAACQADDAPRTQRGLVDFRHLHKALAKAVDALPDAPTLPGHDYCRRIWETHKRLGGDWNRSDAEGNPVSMRVLLAASKLPADGADSFDEVIKQPGIGLEEVQAAIARTRTGPSTRPKSAERPAEEQSSVWFERATREFNEAVTWVRQNGGLWPALDVDLATEQRLRGLLAEAAANASTLIVMSERRARPEVEAA